MSALGRPAICCTHPQPRIDSPEPPSRPLASIDSIFAAAALPEDHPHALHLADPKPNSHQGILRSPNIAAKLKLQFRRRSVKALRSEGEYDSDAHALSSREVLWDVAEEGPDGLEPGVQASDDEHAELPDDAVRTASPLPASSGVRNSVLGGLEWLKPLLRRTSQVIVPGEESNVADVALRVAAEHPLPSPLDEQLHFFLGLPKAYSSPDLLPNERDKTIELPRSLSENDGRFVLACQAQSEFFVPLNVPVQLQADEAISDGAEDSASLVLSLQLKESNELDDGILASSDPCCDNPSIDQGNDTDDRANNMHLDQMDISNQLRSLSQLSDAKDAEDRSLSPGLWNFHRRELQDIAEAPGMNTLLEQDADTANRRNMVSSPVCRVRSPAASSIYSRPSSASGYETAPYEIPRDFYSSLADWPLKPSRFVEHSIDVLREIGNKSAASERRNKPLPQTPDNNRKESGTASFVTTNNDVSFSNWLLPPPQIESASSKLNSSILTKTSKQSRFSERFSPPKKIVKERRSIFKFLRPGSRKQQDRSISTPILASKASDTLDGHSDDPPRLNVEYELEERPKRQWFRSASMSQLRPVFHPEASSSSAPVYPPQRRPTMAKYERTLSSIGDDRRRPSTANLRKLEEAREEDRRDSSVLRPRLSRAHPLNDEVNPLMALALEKHQEEKAMFRSVSKHKESLKHSERSMEPTNSFTDPTVKSSSPDSSKEEHSKESIDDGRQIMRSHSYGGLLAPQQSTSPRRGSTSTSLLAPSDFTISTIDRIGKNAPRSTRIGTSLASWSRYPSHTRYERCGSARSIDAITSRDFAVDVDPNDIISTGAPDSTTTGSPASKHKGKPKAMLHKSRSLTFSGIVRYYSNLFSTSGFTGQNRRTSVTIGGRVEHPELEMLPPALPTDHAHSHHDPLGHLKDLVEEDVDKLKSKVREGEDKVHDYVHKEEAQLESFVRKHEDQFDNFLKKGEAKLKTRQVHDDHDRFGRFAHHGLHDKHSSRGSSPFREGSLFEERRRDHQQRSVDEDEMLGPSNEVDGYRTMDNAGLRLDGAATVTATETKSSPSKAEVWSNVYKECLQTRPASACVRRSKEWTSSLPARNLDIGNMPPPALKPVKPRSSEAARDSDIEPQAVIRRFPSVTVVDDRKGHWRSVSLISVRTGASAALERESTYDLLELVKKREQEEREKLLVGRSDSLIDWRV